LRYSMLGSKRVGWFSNGEDPEEASEEEGS
jgi:hypothetical protein